MESKKKRRIREVVIPDIKEEEDEYILKKDLSNHELHDILMHCKEDVYPTSDFNAPQSVLAWWFRKYDHFIETHRNSSFKYDIVGFWNEANTTENSRELKKYSIDTCGDDRERLHVWSKDQRDWGTTLKDIHTIMSVFLYITYKSFILS
jgi:hypothetical protein